MACRGRWLDSGELELMKEQCSGCGSVEVMVLVVTCTRHPINGVRSKYRQPGSYFPLHRTL